MKMIAGAFCLRLFELLAEPLLALAVILAHDLRAGELMKWASTSFATAFAIRVLPVPGGP